MSRSRLLHLILPLLLVTSAPTLVRAAAPIDGQWHGTLMGLQLVLHVRSAPDGALAGTLDSPEQGAKDIPIDTVRLDGDTLRLELEALAARFEGVRDEIRDVYEGTWTQGGASMPLTFGRSSEAAKAKRPQEPKPPFPYREEEVTYESPRGKLRLAGTLTIPAGRAPAPAVLLLSGSGAQDRDEAVFGHRPFLVLADHLARQGIAVLRVDDRGVGGSGGSLARSTLSDLADDALAAVAFLKSRPEIDPKRIGLLGHSEGGVVAPIAASRSRGDVKFLVLLAGIGVPGDSILLRQAEDLARGQGAPDEQIAREREIRARLLLILKEEGDSATIAPRIRPVLDELLMLIPDTQVEAMGGRDNIAAQQMHLVSSRWLRSFTAHDPRPVLEEIRCPVLALIGEKDRQVRAKENLAAIEAALRKAGNKDVTTRALPGLNHLFQTCETGSILEYAAIEETMAPAVLEEVAAWITRQTTVPGRR